MCSARNPSKSRGSSPAVSSVWSRFPVASSTLSKFHQRKRRRWPPKMAILRNLFDGALQIRADMGGTPAPGDDFWYQPIGSRSATGIRVTPESAKQVSTVLACVSKIAKTQAMLPLKIYKDTPDGGKKIAKSHPLFPVLYSRPNALQTAFEWRQMMQGHLELRNNAYSEIIPGKKRAIDQLVPMHPDRVHPEQLQSGRIRYRYNDPLTSMDRFLMAEQVFHRPSDWLLTAGNSGRR